MNAKLISPELLQKIKSIALGLYVGNYEVGKEKHFVFFLEEEISFWEIVLDKSYKGLDIEQGQGNIVVNFDIHKIWEYYNSNSINKCVSLNLSESDKLALEILEQMKIGVKGFMLFVEGNTSIKIFKRHAE